MTKAKKETSQLTIYEWIKKQAEAACSSMHPAPGSLDINKEIKAAMSQDIRHAMDEHGKYLSCNEVAARMSDLLGEQITEDTLYNWTAPSHSHKINAYQIPAFIIATGGQRRTVEAISKHSGLFLLPSPEALRAEIQQFRETENRAKNERRKREIYLKEIEG